MRPVLFSLMKLMPSEGIAGQGLAAGTMSANKRSTSFWLKWMDLSRMKG
jgi:hypothetical protein